MRVVASSNRQVRSLEGGLTNLGGRCEHGGMNMRMYARAYYE